MRHGGKILVDQLARQGVGYAFLVPGESFLAALDGMFEVPNVRPIVCRHEGSAVMMAQAVGKLTGNPGVAFVTRGPGAANAVAGVYLAREDETPLILFVGLPPLSAADRHPFQVLDLHGLFGTICKWVDTIPSADRVADYVSRAFHIAASGRPGPVVIGLPENVLAAEADVPDALVFRPPASDVSARVMDELAERIGRAEQPLMIVGGPGWNAQAQADVEAFASRFDIPILAAFRAQDCIDNRHPSYAGHLGLWIDPRLASAVKASDLLIVLGAPLDDVTTGGFELIRRPKPQQFLVRVHPAPEAAASPCRADLPICATVGSFASALATLQTPTKRPWSTFRRDLRKAYEIYTRPKATRGSVQFEQVIHRLSAHAPPDTIFTNGAGNYSSFVHRYMTHKGFGSQLAPRSGYMGYGLPAAIGAKFVHPERPVVAFAGDGCFMMSAQELATAVQYDLPLVVIVANNSMYGTIRMHQERTYPGRVVGTSIVNPDFAAFARSFGAFGETVTATDAFLPVFDQAVASNRPAVIDLKLDPEALTTDAAMSAIRAAARKTRQKPGAQE